MSISKTVEENTFDANRKDNFEPVLVHVGGLHFPCNVCMRGGNELADECQVCRYFFN